MRVLGDPLAASIAGSTIIAIVEIAALGSLDPGLVAVVAVFFGALGVAIAAVIAAQEAIVSRFELRGWTAACVRAAGSLAPLMFVARSLFEGSRAAQLPGAAYGTIWVPSLGYAAIALAVYAGGRWVVPHRRRRRVFAAAVVAFVIAAELANRRLFRSEYADVHAFLIAVSCVGLSLALWLGSGADRNPAWTRRRAVVWIAAGVFAGGCLALALGSGLGNRANRWLVATKGSHARHIARVLRGVFDSDRDGFASVLGGGDCDDSDPAVYPGAAEVFDNDKDEDCDGVDLSAPIEPPDARARARILAEWLASDDVGATLARTRNMNVLVIAIDALRADALLSDAGARTMPRCSALAAESVSFERAFAPSAGTDLSVSSVVTGRIDPFVVLESTLPEAMQRSGRRTVAILPSEVLRYAGKVLLSRGVDDLVRYVNDRGKRDVGSYTTTADVTRKGLSALRASAAADKPFYMWLHYFDVHEHLQIEASDPELSALSERFDLGTRAGKYAALTAITDAGVGRILDALTEHGLAGDTIVVLLSDHGESLAEDPRLPDNHGRFVYNPLTHIPLVIRVPGHDPRTVDVAVSLVDLAPTVGHLAGTDAIDGADGTTLLPHLIDGAPEQLRSWTRPIVMHESEQWGVIDWPLKLMVRPAENLTELYDLSVDFAEQRDLSAQKPDDVRALRGLYASFPEPSLDRTRAGRKRRDALARPPSNQ